MGLLNGKLCWLNDMQFVCAIRQIYEEWCCTPLGGISEDRSLHERGEIVIRTLLFQTRSHINFPLFCLERGNSVWTYVHKVEKSKSTNLKSTRIYVCGKKYFNYFDLISLKLWKIKFKSSNCHDASIMCHNLCQFWLLWFQVCSPFQNSHPWHWCRYMSACEREPTKNVFKGREGQKQISFV